MEDDMKKGCGAAWREKAVNEKKAFRDSRRWSKKNHFLHKRIFLLFMCLRLAPLACLSELSKLCVENLLPKGPYFL